MSEIKSNDVKCSDIGWYFVECKTELSKDCRDKMEVAESFRDWVFFDGDKWEMDEYREFGFYVSWIIKGEIDL